MTLPRQTIVLSLAAAGALAAAAALSHVGGRVAPALDGLQDASRPWLALAVVAFLAAFAGTVGAWRAALAGAGARLGVRQAAARIATGALVNAFAPAKIGDAVKIALCSRALDAPDRLWTTGGAYAALAATRSLALAALVVVAAATHALPLWPVFVLVGGAAAVAVLAAASSRVRRHHRLASLLAGAGALARTPRAPGRHGCGRGRLRAPAPAPRGPRHPAGARPRRHDPAHARQHRDRQRRRRRRARVARHRDDAGARRRASDPGRRDDRQHRLRGDRHPLPPPAGRTRAAPRAAGRRPRRVRGGRRRRRHRRRQPDLSAATGRAGTTAARGRSVHASRR